MMDLLPAIDLIDGGAVRLVQGEFDRQTAYGDPLALARGFLAAGARWVHVVDLDAARTGEPVNRAVVKAIAAEAGRHGARVQTGGGVRTTGDVEDLLAAGVHRVVLGTAAVEDPSLAEKAAGAHPGAVAVGLDYRRRADGRLEAAARGWLEGSGRTVGELLDALAGVPLGAVVVTAIDRDGTLAGPDTAGLVEVLAGTDLPVVASGGVGSAADLRALADLRAPVDGREGAGPGGRALAGAIVGKALVDGRLTVEQGLAACAPSG
ncbi:MAG TPA: HisA/HisF-related TIM barrel protein [Acidimicrobiales bacterium]|nr:HisA/HisF-related TIM barrel protein [Acidimicrobiales bacterium]